MSDPLRWAGFRPVWAALGLCLSVCPPALAEAVWGERFTLLQPDGTPLPVRIWGDEYYGVTETLDGYTLVRDPWTFIFCYARLSDDGNALVSTGVRPEAAGAATLGLAPHVRIRPEAAAAQAEAARARFAEDAQAAMGGQRALRGPSTGSVTGITLIVQFPDVPGTIPPSDVSSYCNQVGYTGYGNNGSVRDYFHDVSEGRLTYTNYVPSAYYTAAHPRSYYTDPAVPYGQRARELIIEALSALDGAGFDFSQHDADGNGTVDALNCFYAGSRVNNWAEGLWPHASSVYFSADGVHTGPYQITDMQDSLRLSTFCHENGHMLMGWPDLYDYGYDSSGVGRFCIMCYSTSATNPQEPCAYLKSVAGWASVTVLTAPQAGLSVPVTGNAVFRFPHPTKYNEYYLVENRQRSGRDSGLPDRGLAIWHVDTLGSNNNQQMTPQSHYQVTLVQADGRWDLEHGTNSGDSTDLWAAPSHTQCTPDTSPDTSWWDGAPSGLAITHISATGPVMTFDFGIDVDCNGNGVPDYDDILGGTSADCNGNGVPDECDVAGGAAEDCDGNQVPDDCQPDCNADSVADACELLAPAGLVGVYYDFWDFSGPRRVRLDDTIDFDWGSGPAVPGLSSDTFSVRWSGLVTTPDVPGTYTFFPRTDDGVRLWVDGRLLVDQWVGQAPTEWSGSVTLAARTAYPVVMEYFEHTGGAVAELRWQPPGGVKEIIPAANLAPGLDCNANGVPDTCDLADGASSDVDGNRVPDECDLLDCNGNGTEDAGDLAAGISPDANGNGVPDECEAEVLYVHAAATGSGTGLNWADAFVDLQDALTLARRSSTAVSQVWVASGAYRPDRGTGLASFTFPLVSGVALYGGFAGGEASVDDRKPGRHPTVLTGDLGADHAYHVLTGSGADASAILDGFVIAGGNADGPDYDGVGGGLLNLRGSPTIRNCVFRDNRADRNGGAVSNQLGSALTLVNCLFSGNRASNRGGAVQNHDAFLTAVNCTFFWNVAQLSGTTEQGEGGGLFMNLGDVTLRNCVFWQNLNSLGWLDEAAQIHVLAGTLDIEYSTVQHWTGGLGGSGNDGSDPRFVDASGPDGNPGTADDNLRLLPGSPAIDAGDNAAVPTDLGTDVEGDLRFRDDPRTPDGGAGTAPIVDRGGYEYVPTADFDGDLDADLVDVAAFQRCFGGIPEGACGPANVAGGSEVDEADFAAFVRVLTGP